MRKIVVALALASLTLTGLTACGKSQPLPTQEQQMADSMNDGRSLGLNPTAVVVEPGKTETVKVWDATLKKKVKKTVTSKTEVEIAFSLGECRFEADRDLNAGGNPNVVEGFRFEIEDGSDDLDLGVFGALNKQQVIDTVNGLPVGERPACWKP